MTDTYTEGSDYPENSDADAGDELSVMPQGRSAQLADPDELVIAYAGGETYAGDPRFEASPGHTGIGPLTVGDVSEAEERAFEAVEGQSKPPIAP